MSDGQGLERRERILFALAVACASALMVAIALPLFLGQIHLDSDLLNFHLPVRFFYQRALREGSEFLWFPYEFAGFYLHGEGQAGLYHPLNLLAYRWLPFFVAFDLEIVRSYGFALLGAFLFFRRYALPRSAALLGGILFAFSGFQVLHYMHTNLVAATAHLPWLLLALDVLVRGGSPTWMALAGPIYALCTASQLLLGHPQAIWMSSFVEVLYCLLLWRGGAPAQAFIRPAIARLLGVLAAAVQILPTLDALRHSTRANPSLEFLTDLAIYPHDRLQLLQPYLLTHRVVEESTHELGLYLGAFGAIALAWLAVARSAAGPCRLLGRGALVLAWLGTLLALGSRGGLHWLLIELPLVGLFRVPGRYLWLIQIASAVAAALVFADLVREGPRRPTRARLVVAIGLPVLSVGLAWLVHASEPEATQGPWSAVVGVALVGTTALLVLLATRGGVPALAALLLLACADLGAYGFTFVQQRQPRPHTLAELQSRLRVSVPDGAPRHRLLDGPMASTILGVRYVFGYVAMWPDRELPIFHVDTPLLDLDADELAVWRAGMRVASVAHRVSGPPLPRVRLLTSARVSEDASADIAAIDVATTALVSRPVDLDAGKPGQAAILTESAGELGIATWAMGRQLLVVSEAFHNGWRAWIDGEPGSLLRVYGDFMGVVVTPGKHHVRLHFEPASFTWGARVSALSLLAIGVWLAASLAWGRVRAAD